MGEANRTQAAAERVLTFDFAAPTVVVGLDHEALFAAQTGRGSAGPRAVKLYLEAVGNHGFPKGQLRYDREIWGRWLAAIHPHAPDRAEITLGMLRWLDKRISDPELALPAWVAQWDGAVREYVDALLAAAGREGTSA